jgi:hypothetical protein
MPISNWSTTAADNDDSDAASGINLAEGMAPGQVNNSNRAMMAEIAEWQQGLSDKYIAPVGTAAAPTFTFNGDTDTGAYRAGVDTLGWSTGGTLRLSLSTTSLVSTLPYVAPAGSAANPSYIFTDDLDTGIYSAAADSLGFSGGGTARLFIVPTATHPGADNAYSLGASSFRWTQLYAATTTISTSDATQKTEVTLSDAVLRAVYRVPLKAFKFNDAIASKGEANARVHYGYFAQDVEAELIAEGVDPSTQAFWCEDTLDDGTTRQGLRYEEFATVRKEAERRVAAGTLTV